MTPHEKRGRRAEAPSSIDINGNPRAVTLDDVTRAADFVVACIVHADRTTDMPLEALIEAGRAGDGLSLAPGTPETSLFRIEGRHATALLFSLMDGSLQMAQRPSPWVQHGGEHPEPSPSLRDLLREKMQSESPILVVAAQRIPRWTALRRPWRQQSSR